MSAVGSSASSPHAAIVRVSAIAPTAHTVLAAFSIVCSPSRSLSIGTRGAVDPSRVSGEGSQDLTGIAVAAVVAVALGPQRGLRAIGDAEGADHDREGAIELGRLEIESLGDHLVGAAAGQHAEHLLLGAGSRASRRGSRWPEMSARAARGASGDSPRAAARIASGMCGRVVVGEEIPARSRGDGVEDVARGRRRSARTTTFVAGERWRIGADRGGAVVARREDGDVGQGVARGEVEVGAACEGGAHVRQGAVVGCEDSDRAHGVGHGSMTTQARQDRQRDGRRDGRPVGRTTDRRASSCYPRTPPGQHPVQLVELVSDDLQRARAAWRTRWPPASTSPARRGGCRRSAAGRRRRSRTSAGPRPGRAPRRRRRRRSSRASRSPRSPSPRSA